MGGRRRQSHSIRWLWKEENRQHSVVEREPFEEYFSTPEAEATWRRLGNKEFAKDLCCLQASRSRLLREKKIQRSPPGSGKAQHKEPPGEERLELSGAGHGVLMTLESQCLVPSSWLQILWLQCRGLSVTRACESGKM